MAKEKKKAPEVSLVEIAEAMNEIMAYGQDPKTGKVDESELIDVELTDKALKAEILKRAEEDLRASDEDDFTPEMWSWFIDNGIIPAGSEGNGAGIPDDGDDDPDAEGDPEGDSEGNPESEDGPDADNDDGDDDPEPEPKAKKTAQKAASPASKTKTQGKAQADEKDGETGKKNGKKGTPPPRTMVEGGNENYAKSLVKKKVKYAEFEDEFRKLYQAVGKDDENYIKARAHIYWNIAHKALGITPKDGPAKSSNKKATEKPEPKVVKAKDEKKEVKKGKHK